MVNDGDLQGPDNTQAEEHPPTFEGDGSDETPTHKASSFEERDTALYRKPPFQVLPEAIEDPVVRARVDFVADHVADVMGTDFPTPHHALSPEALDKLWNDIYDNRAQVHEVLFRLHRGELVPDERLFNFLIAGLLHYRGVDLLEVLSSYASQFQEHQKLQLFHQLFEDPWLRKHHLTRFFKKKLLDPHLPFIHTTLLYREEGLPVLSWLAQNELYFPDEDEMLVFERKLMDGDRFGFEVLQSLVQRTDHPFPVLEPLQQEYESLEQRYADSDVFLEFLRNDPNYASRLARIFEDINEERADTNDPVAMALSRLMERDLPSYLLLIENYDEVEPEYVQALLDGRFYERADQDGDAIRAYITRELGAGGLGRVYHSRFVRGEDRTMRFGASKVPHQRHRRTFEQERRQAGLVQQWDSPYVNKALAITEDFIVYESALQSANLLESRDRLPPRELLRLFLDVIDGVLEYQRRGFVHGDLKGMNVLVLRDAAGQRAQLIDNSPVEVKDSMFRYAANGEALPTWACTPDYMLNSEWTQFVARDTVNHFYAIDNWALYRIFEHEMGPLLESRLTNDQFNVIKGIFETFAKGDELYQKGASLRLREAIEKFMETLPDQSL